MGRGTKRALLRILALSAGVLGAAAQADDATRTTPTPDETTAVERCVFAGRTSADRRSCIGVVAKPCQNTPDGASTVGSSACLSREFEVWDGLLNRFYREAAAAFDDDGRSYLRGVQRTWIGFRDQACQWPYKVFPTGSIVGPLSAGCMLNQTALRAIDMLDIETTLKER